MSKLKNIIPIFREFIANNTNIVIDDILNANSLFKSDISKISSFGNQLLTRRREDIPFILFSVDLNNIITSEQDKIEVSMIYEATLSIDCYGDSSSEVILELQAKMLSQDSIHYFMSNAIGINPEFEVSSSYETINGVQWLRTIANIRFTYEKTVIVTNEEVLQLGDIRKEKK